MIEPNCEAFTNSEGDVIIDVNYDLLEKKVENVDILETTQLSIFSHRFMSIAEQMGRYLTFFSKSKSLNCLILIFFSKKSILQRTSVSTNIKERLDYSCAMFDSTGGLVANAPHIPGIS